MREISEDIYAETAFLGCNVGFIITDGGLVLIDTPMLPSDADQWSRDIRSITDRDFSCLINTDHHFDHIVGNSVFDTITIAHHLTCSEIERMDDSWKQRLLEIARGVDANAEIDFDKIKISPPMVTFSDRMTLNMGGKTVEMIHVGGHTPATCMVYVPENRLLFSGDTIFSNMHPFLGQADTRQWQAALALIEEMEVEVIVPGHGEVCGKEEARKQAEYLGELRERVARLRGRDCSKEQAIEKVNMLGFYPTDETTEARARDRLTVAVGKIYDELAVEDGETS